MREVLGNMDEVVPSFRVVLSPTDGSVCDLPSILAVSLVGDPDPLDVEASLVFVRCFLGDIRAVIFELD